MEELNMEEATSTIRGGEKLALEGLDAYLKDKKAVIDFEKPKTNPGACNRVTRTDVAAEFDPPSTTQLSPHLKVRCRPVESTDASVRNAQLPALLLAPSRNHRRHQAL